MRTLLLLLGLFALFPATAAAAPPAPFGHPCSTQNGVRFCPTAQLTDRVASFDGVPLDVDVTLPPSGDGPFPTIVMLHGYGGDKTDYEATRPEGKSSTTYHWNSNFFARRGYAVVNSTARGFGRSCGQPATRTPDCAKGWIHLADQRYEARDTQHLLGLLADEGIAKPGALGVTGISYGGGQSLELAYLRDRVRMPDGAFAPWRSPKGTPLSIAAAYPRWLWSDLVNALLPNGRFLDFRVSGPTESREPIGVAIQSFISGLYALGSTTGFYAPPGADPGADLTTWYARVQAGEPYGTDARAITDEIHDHHQGYGLPGTPAPLLLHGGWTDDLFPSSEPLRVYNALRAANPGAPVSLQLADLGHQRGSNKADADRALNDEGAAFLDAYLRGVGSPPAPGSVTAFVQTCPQSAPAGAPFKAASWPDLHPGAVTFGSRTPQTVESSGGNPETAQAFDPVSGGGDACRSTQSESAPGTATYTAPPSSGYTLLGRPTVTADIRTAGANGQLVSRLWDIDQSGRQVLISRGVYRLTDDQRGTITFQLSGDGYKIAPGHTPRLEVLGRDAPYYRASNGAFRVTVSDLSIVLPVAERPGTVPGVTAPPAQLRALARLRPRLSVRVRYDRRRRILRTRGRLILPAGVGRARGCRGRITVRVKARRRAISTRRASVRHRTCRFASRTRIRRRARLGRAKRVTVRVRYGGSAALTPVKARARRVRIRR
jgi:predicted acyl esterase